MAEETKAPAYALVDYQGTAFLVCIWTMAFLLIAGLDLRRWVEQNAWPRILLIWVLLAIGAKVFQYILIRRSESRITGNLGGKRVQLYLEPAPDDFAAPIRERAREFGIKAIRVLYIPCTWNTVDAYATGFAGDPVIVLSGGALGLAVLEASERAKFRFLVDHELAHITHGDIGRYYFARGLLLASAALACLKMAGLLILHGGEGLRQYQSLFPRALFVDYSQSLLGSLRQQPPSPYALAVSVLIYTVCAYLLMASLYVLIVRRREFWADRAAVRNSPDPELARSALLKLTASKTLLSLPQQSMGGRRLWHPHPRRRVAQQAQDRPFGRELYSGFVSLLFLLTLLSIRFVLSSRDLFWTNLSAAPNKVAWICSGLFLLFAVFCIDSLLTPYIENGRKPPFRQALKGYAILLATAFLLGGLAALLDIYSWRALFPASNALRNSPFLPLANLELNSRLLLVASFPASVTVLATSRLLLTACKDRGDRVLYSASFSAIVIMLVSHLLNPILNDYRAAALNGAQDQVLHAVQVLIDQYKGDIGSPASSDAKLWDGDSTGLMMILARTEQTPFSWPQAFFIFWQTPFQSPTADSVSQMTDLFKHPTGDQAKIQQDIEQYIQNYNQLKAAGKPPDQPEPKPLFHWDARQAFDDGLRKLQDYDPVDQRKTSEELIEYGQLRRSDRDDYRKGLPEADQALLEWYDRLSGTQRKKLADTLDPLLDIKRYAATFDSEMKVNQKRQMADLLDQFDGFRPSEKGDLYIYMEQAGKGDLIHFYEYYDRYSKADKQFLKEFLRGNKLLSDAPVEKPSQGNVPAFNPADLYTKSPMR